jgi:hypothetical protein
MQAEKDKPKADDKPQKESGARVFFSERLKQLLVIVVILTSMGIPFLEEIKTFWRNSILNNYFSIETLSLYDLLLPGFLIFTAYAGYLIFKKGQTSSEQFDEFDRSTIEKLSASGEQINKAFTDVDSLKIELKKLKND